MAKTIIIDGYNLANASQQIRTVIAGDRLRARQMLIDLLSKYKKAFGFEIIVIFDGTAGKEVKTDSNGGIKIYFSRPPKNADQVIKEKVDSLKISKTLTVVTSDRAIVNYVKGRQVQTMPAKTFLDKMELDLAKRGQSQEKPEKVNVSEWMEYFNVSEKE